MKLNAGEHLVEVLRRRTILLDTNILSEAARHAARFLEFFDTLRAARSTPAITELIRYEFLAGIHENQLRESRERFLKDLKVLCIPMHPLAELTRCAVEITNDLCRHKERGGLGVVDTLHIALLEKYQGNLVLATRNHKDFPTSILTREVVFAIDAEGQDVAAYGVYSWRGRHP